MLFVIYRYFSQVRGNLRLRTNSDDTPALKFRDLIKILMTFTFTTFAWIFFRSSSVNDAFTYISTVFSNSFFELPAAIPYTTLLMIMFFVAIEWIGRKDQYGIARIGLNWKRPARLAFYYVLILVIFVFAGTPKEFIYFQF